MHSNEQLMQVQPAARIYCKKIGVNPDNEVEIPHPEGLAVLVKRPVWMFIGDQMVEMMLMLQSIKEAEQEKFDQQVAFIETVVPGKLVQS